jgi:membrane protease YdiL (CAAX protease family)
MPQSNEEKQQSDQKRSNKWDITVGIVLFFVLAFGLIIVARQYWFSHGAKTQDFKFWTEDAKWLEVIYWSTIAALIHELWRVADRLMNLEFEGRAFFEYLIAPIVGPILTLPFVLIIFNLEISLGIFRMSLKELEEAGIPWMIGLAVIGGFFHRTTRDVVTKAPEWFLRIAKQLFERKDQDGKPS